MIFNRLKFILIVALLASNLLVGALSLYYLDSLNERYAALFDRSVPLINSLRTLTRELGAVQRMARRVIDPSNEVAWKDLVQQLDDGSSSAGAHARVLTAMDLFKGTRINASILRSSTEYDERVDAFLVLVRGQKLVESNQYLADALRPAYDRYMLVLDAAAAHVAREGVQQSASYAAESRLFGNFLLAFAGWPLLVGGAIILLAVVVLLFFFASVLLPGYSWRKPAAN